MTPGLCLDSGELIPAAELNRRINMELNLPTLPQPKYNVIVYTPFEVTAYAQQVAEPLQKRIDDLGSEIIEQARIVGMGAERELSLLANFETAKRRIKELEAQLASEQSLDHEIKRLRGIVPEILEELNDQMCEENERMAKRIAELEAKELALHKILAESVLHANTGWAQNESLRAAIRKRLAQPITNGKKPVVRAGNPDLLRALASLLNLSVPARPIASGQEPLSDDQIFTACENVLCVYPNAQTTLDIARAIEAMLSSKEKP